MAKKRSSAKNARKKTKSPSGKKGLPFFEKSKIIIDNPKRWRKKRNKNNPHKSFKRTYREDYIRETNIPGIMQHIVDSFRMIFKNYKLFLPFLVLLSINESAVFLHHILRPVS